MTDRMLWGDDTPRTLGVIGRQYARDAFAEDFYRAEREPPRVNRRAVIVFAAVIATGAGAWAFVAIRVIEAVRHG